MTERSRIAYNAVFGRVKELFPEFQPRVAMTDFEKGLRRAIQESFGLKKEKCLGCWFHYSQASFNFKNPLPDLDCKENRVFLRILNFDLLEIDS